MVVPDFIFGNYYLEKVVTFNDVIYGTNIPYNGAF